MSNLPEQSVLLTVIVPVGKMENRLRDLFSWIETSRDFPMKVILVHDQSGDSTGEQLRDFLSKGMYPRVKLLSGTFGNPGQTRNIGMLEVNSEWVTFWDSDDLPRVENFLEMVSSADLNNADCAVGCFETSVSSMRSQVKKFELNSSGQGIYASIAMNPGIWRWAFKARIVSGAEFLPIRMGEDVCFLAGIKIADQRTYYSSEVVYTYFLGNEGQLTGNRENLKDLNYSVKYLVDQFPQSSASMRRFLSILICRQVITVLLRADQITKVQLIKQLILGAGLWGHFIRDLMPALIFVIKNREPLK
jgi:glycosyltransferase involved in cell wall biosynthesis